MLTAAYALISVHTLLILMDEVGFHYRREIPRWERIGHPLDTLTVLVPIALALHSPVTTYYWIAAVFSCIFVAKDEWVHARLCKGTEHFIHALLFLLHPLLFFCIAVLVRQAPNFLLFYLLAAGVFGLYQIIFWNFYAKQAPDQQPDV